MSSLVYGNGPINIDFDDPKLSGDGGLMLVGALFERLGVAETAGRWVHVDGDGSANVGPKLETLVASMIAGGSHIDHANRLRAGATDDLLAHHTYAPSTLGRCPAQSIGHPTRSAIRPCPPGRSATPPVSAGQ